MSVSTLLQGNFPGDKPNYDGVSWKAVPDRGPPAYIVFVDANDSNKIKALNCTSGRIDYQGTNPTTVIQSALNNLTVGRTWKERVIVKGGYTIASTINLPSYTIFELAGRMTLAAAANIPILNVPNGTVGTPIQFVDVEGGIYDGNNTNQTNPTYLVDANSTFNRLNVRGATFLNPVSQWAIHASASSSQHLRVQDCVVEDNALNPNTGLVFADVMTDVKVVHNRSYNCDIDFRAASPTGFDFSHNYAEGGEGGGITIVGGTASDGVLIGNVIRNKLKEAIEVVTVSHAAIVGNQAYNCTREFLHAWQLTDSLVTDNMAYNCGAQAPDGYAIPANIYLGFNGNPCLRNLIVGNKVISTQASLPQYGVYEVPGSGSDYNRLRQNWIEGYTIARVLLSGAHSTHDFGLAGKRTIPSFAEMSGWGGQSSLSNAGRWWMYPVNVPCPYILTGLGFVPQTSSGNVRLGLYPDNGDLPDGANPVVQTASTAAGTGGQKQEIAVTATYLQPGQYWPGISADNTTLTVDCYSGGEKQKSGTLSTRRFDQTYGAMPSPCPATSNDVDAKLVYLVGSAVV